MNILIEIQVPAAVGSADDPRVPIDVARVLHGLAQRVEDCGYLGAVETCGPASGVVLRGGDNIEFEDRYTGECYTCCTALTCPNCNPPTERPKQ